MVRASPPFPFLPCIDEAGAGRANAVTLGGLYEPDWAPLWAPDCGVTLAPGVSVGTGCRSGFVLSLIVTCMPGNASSTDGRTN